MGKRKFAVYDYCEDDNAMNLADNMSAYEVTTMKILKDDTKESDMSNPQVLYASRNNWLLISVDSDLHIFDMSMGCNELGVENSRRLDTKSKIKQSFLTCDDGHIVNMQFLPSSDVFMLLLNTGTFLFSSPVNRFLHKQSLINAIEDCSMHIVSTGSELYSISILDRQNSILYFVEIPVIRNPISNEETFQQHFNSVKLIRSLNIRDCKLHFITHIANSFVFFPKSSGEWITSVSLYSQDIIELTKMLVLREDMRVVKNVGTFVVALTYSGKLMFYDQNLILNHTLSLSDDKQLGNYQVKDILDFEFLDISDTNEFTPQVKIMFKVETATGVQLQIRQFNEMRLLFGTNCSKCSFLIPFTAQDDDNNIVYIDVFPVNCSDSIYIRFVGESQPIQRLNKLLNFKRFDEALNFAKLHNLSLDLVYAPLVRHYLEQLHSRDEVVYEDKVFDEMLRNLELLSDNNNAAELCVAALPFLRRYSHIKSILHFVKQLNITDEYTMAEIERFRYELASYRMIYGTDEQFYGQNSEWNDFLSSETHTDLFHCFCENGKIVEARILYTRYAYLADLLNELDHVTKLLSIFRKSISKNTTLCSSISEFIKSNLITVLFYSSQDSKRACAILCDFLIEIAMFLERDEPKCFPQNSLNFAQTFNRAIELLKIDCNTLDEYVAFSHILKQLDEDEKPEQSSVIRLKILIKNLTELVKIHTVYNCRMSYSEFITHDVNSVCYQILDRVRSAPSVRKHIVQFVFPYIDEHNLNRNEMLYAYIKNFASTYYSDAPTRHDNNWDLLNLQIAEQITDLDVQCRAIIEIAAGTIPPWNKQTSNAVKNILAQEEKIDPELIRRLGRQCLYADLGQIFIKYGIPLNVRSRIIGSMEIKSLLKFVFKHSDNEMVVKLQDAFNIVDIYENLQNKPILTRVECYHTFATVLIQQFTDEWEIQPLVDLFELIKPEDQKAKVASKCICYLKCLLHPTTIKKILLQRQIWLACLICVLERFMPNDSNNNKLIRKARNIRNLQLKHNIIVDYGTLENKTTCIKMLRDFIEMPNEKSIIEVVCFGKLLDLSVRDTCITMMAVQMRRNSPEAVLKTLAYLLSNENSPTKEHLENALEACKYICWKFTDLLKDEESGENILEFSKCIIKQLESIIPTLIEWSVRMEEISFVESYSLISRYVSFYSLILEQFVDDHEKMKSTLSDKQSCDAKSINDQQKTNESLYTMDPRLGIFFPKHEGAIFDVTAVVKALSVVASSIVEPPVERDNVDEFNNQMRESWEGLFSLLSRSHAYLEIIARRLANDLPCFNSNANGYGALINMRRHITELCKKIFNEPIADLYLAAHLLCSLKIDELKQTLSELRQWIISKKNVRLTINLMRVSLFVLIQTSQDISLVKQIAKWLQSALWQKRLLKHGLNLTNIQFKKEHLFDLAPEFAKIFLPPSFIHKHCSEMNVDAGNALLNYAIELCKFSNCLLDDPQRLTICIETAKVAFQHSSNDADAVLILNKTLDDICPYNYEAIELILFKLQELISNKVLNNEKDPIYADSPITDYSMLMKFLKSNKREGQIAVAEIRWYKQYSKKYGDISMLSKSSQIGHVEDSMMIAASNEISIMPNQIQETNKFQQRHDLLALESNMPKSAKTRLPFHLFTTQNQESIKNYQTPLIFDEITIYNVHNWITIVELTKNILQHSRTSLLVGAINSHIRDVVKYKRKLCDDQLKQIQKLIYESHNRLSILKGLASRFTRLQLGQTKISLIKLCNEIIDKWIENFALLQIPEDQHSTFEQNKQTFNEMLAVLQTEFLLEENKLLDADTAALISKPGELINHLLCTKKIEWTDPDSIVKCFGIVNEISKIYSIDLDKIFNSLIRQWVNGRDDQANEGIVQVVNADPNNTIDFFGSTDQHANTIGIACDMEFMLPVLYDDPETTRIVMLIKKIKNSNEMIIAIYRTLLQDVSLISGGWMTKIRIATCILRLLNDDEMKQLLGTDYNQFCCNFVTMLNDRLYSICRVEIPVQDSQTKLDLIHSILSPKSIYRQTPEIAHLLFCLIIDNEIDDPNLLSTVAQRLLQLKLDRHLLQFLRYIRRTKDVKNIRNIAMFFGRAFEAIFNTIDYSTKRSDLVELVYFLIGCPVEGNGHFLRPISLLNAIHACSEAILVTIADSAIADVNYDSQSPPGEAANFEMDLKKI